MPRIGLGRKLELPNTTVVMGSTADPNLILHLDAGNPTSYPGSGSTWADISGNSNDFSLIGSFAYNGAVGGGCLEFQGTGEYAQFADGFGTFNTPDYTIIIWWYYNGLTSQGIWSYDFTSHVSPFYAQHLRTTNTTGNWLVNADGTAPRGISPAGVYAAGNWYQTAMTCKVSVVLPEDSGP